MIKVLLMSDCHQNSMAFYPERMFSEEQSDEIIYNNKPDILIHLGDIENINWLDKIKNEYSKMIIYAVDGNWEKPKKITSLSFKILNWNFYINHGDNGYYSFDNFKKKFICNEEKIMKELNYVPDIICLGHTHFQQHSILKKPYFFNPGSTNYFLHGNVEEKQYNIDNKTFKGKKIGSYDIMLIQEKIMKIEEWSIIRESLTNETHYLLEEHHVFTIKNK